jgi:hypothetical protein
MLQIYKHHNNQSSQSRKGYDMLGVMITTISHHSFKPHNVSFCMLFHIYNVKKKIIWYDLTLNFIQQCLILSIKKIKQQEQDLTEKQKKNYLFLLSMRYEKLQFNP